MPTPEEHIALFKSQAQYLIGYFERYPMRRTHPAFATQRAELAALEWAIAQASRSIPNVSEAVCALKTLLTITDDDSVRLGVGLALKALEPKSSPGQLIDIRADGLTISGNVSSNSLAVKKEEEHGHTSTERNQDRSD